MTHLDIQTQQLYIDGQWRSGSTTMLVRNPDDPAQTRLVAVADPGQASDAVDAAVRAMDQPIGIDERAAILRRLSELVRERARQFAETIAFESGKPITAARVEVERAVTTLRLASEEAQRLPGEVVPLPAMGAAVGTADNEPFSFTVAEPVGVIAAITPFNFPLNLVAHKVAPALAAGCAVVLKPSEKTPLTAGLLVTAAEDAGLPPGWLNLVTGSPELIVDEWLAHPDVTTVSFTGSADIGWKLKERSPRKRHLLELGSCTAMVVDSSADLDRAVEAAATGGYTFAGQACISVQRVIVVEPVFDAFVAQLVDRVSALRCGPTDDETTVVGPVISDQAADRVIDWVDEAVHAGATAHCGGRVGPNRIDPIVVTGAQPESQIENSEIFGPVLSVTSAPSLDAAIRRANATDFGLNTAIFTQDLGAALSYARRAEAGAVMINVSPSYRADAMPYGGIKSSGQGREGVKYAISELLEQKLIVLRA